MGLLGGLLPALERHAAEAARSAAVECEGDRYGSVSQGVSVHGLAVTSRHTPWQDCSLPTSDRVAHGLPLIGP